MWRIKRDNKRSIIRKKKGENMRARRGKKRSLSNENNLVISLSMRDLITILMEIYEDLTDEKSYLEKYFVSVSIPIEREEDTEHIHIFATPEPDSLVFYLLKHPNFHAFVIDAVNKTYKQSKEEQKYQSESN